MAMTRVPTPGGDAVPGGYPAPTPHLANVNHDPYEAPTSLPSGNPAPPAATGLDCIEGLGEAKGL